MHLYCMVRGNAPFAKHWVNTLLTKFWPFVYGKQMGASGSPEDVKGYLQMGVRPIQLYELAFPEPELNNVLAMIQPQPCWNSSLQKYIYLVRKFLGLEPIDKLPPATNKPEDVQLRKFVDCTIIGIKKDRYVDGIEQI